MAVLFDNNKFRISYEEGGYLFLKWNGYINSNDFRAAANEIIRAVEQTKATSFVSDNTDCKIISPNDHGWAAYNWFREAESKGVKKLATILSNDYFNRLSEKSIEDMAEIEHMQVRHFKTSPEAIEWIRS